MDQVVNPYNPGAGTRPYEVVGRSSELADMDVALQRVRAGRPATSLIVTGLRGVGKTVLLGEFARTAGRRGYVHEYLEATGDGGMFAARLAQALRKSLFKLGGKKKLKGANRRALGVLKAFVETLEVGLAFHMDVEGIPGVADSGDWASDFGALFEEVGRLARAHDAGVFLTIDETHRLPATTRAAFLMALHRVADLRLPFLVAGAELPTTSSGRGEATVDADRLLRLRPLGPLTPAESAAAVVAPAAAVGVSWKGGAVTRLYEVTQGYPFFVQELARQAWDVAEEGSQVIRPGDVERSIPLALAELDSGFYRASAAVTTGPERAYLRAMAQLGPGAARSGDVAFLLAKKTTQVAPVRDTLIKKAICFSPRFNELAFTVPLFDQFMKRLMPAVQ